MITKEDIVIFCQKERYQRRLGFTVSVNIVCPFDSQGERRCCCLVLRCFACGMPVRSATQKAMPLFLAYDRSDGMHLSSWDHRFQIHSRSCPCRSYHTVDPRENWETGPLGEIAILRVSTIDHVRFVLDTLSRPCSPAARTLRFASYHN